MTIKYRVGHIINDIQLAIESGQPQNFGHGANRCRTMGAGVAGQLARSFPVVRTVDTGIGTYTVAEVAPDIKIFNIYSQVYPGANFELKLLSAAIADLERDGITHMTVPKIGAGIGGGDWEEISKLLSDSSIEFDIVVLTEGERGEQ